MNNICDDIRLVHEEYILELKEHNILEKYKKKKEEVLKFVGSKDNLKYEKLFKSYAEYKRYKNVDDVLKKLDKNVCKGEPLKIKISDIILVRDVWKEEIDKYKILITISGRKQRYKNIIDAIDRILAFYLKKNRSC